MLLYTLVPAESWGKECIRYSSNTCILSCCKTSQAYEVGCLLEPGIREIESQMTGVTDLNSLSFGGGLLAVFSLEDRPPILVKLEGCNNDVAWMDANGDRRAIRLVPLDTIDVDNPLFTVDLSDLSLTTLVLSTDNPDFVILANRY